MSAIELTFLTLLFGAVFSMIMLALRRFASSPVQERLDALTEGALPASKGTSWIRRIVSVTEPLAKLSLPAEGWEGSALRTRFIIAGLRTSSAPPLYFAAKTGLAVSLPLIAFLVLHGSGAKYSFEQLMLWLLAPAACGYYLPNTWLANRVSRRQREIFENFPDALDLLTVCIEAGLAMDAALARIALDIGLKSPILSEELQLVTLELRAGSGKEKALRNLALRTGVDDVESLVTMLIQAERFGTSIADSLRVQSDQLRTKRRQRAEETAARIALKLLFPLIFFIFPALLVVLMGPALIQIYRGLLPAMAAAGAN